MSLDTSVGTAINRPPAFNTLKVPVKKKQPPRNSLDDNNGKNQGKGSKFTRTGNKHTLSNVLSVPSNGQTQQRQPVSSNNVAEFLSRTSEQNGGRTLQGIGQPEDIKGFFKTQRISYRGQPKFEDIWSTTSLRGRQLYLNRERMLLKDGNYVVGYKVEGTDDSYGLMVFNRQGEPITRFSPLNKSVQNYKDKQWIDDSAATFFARTGGAESFNKYSKNAADIHASAPTVLNAERKYWQDANVGITDSDDYTVTYRPMENVTKYYSPVDYVLAYSDNPPKTILKPTRTSSSDLPIRSTALGEPKTVSLNEFLRIKNNLQRGTKVLSIQHKNGEPVSEENKNKILELEREADLQKVHDDMQDAYYREKIRSCVNFIGNTLSSQPKLPMLTES